MFRNIHKLSNLTCARNNLSTIRNARSYVKNIPTSSRSIISTQRTFVNCSGSYGLSRLETEVHQQIWMRSFPLNCHISFENPRYFFTKSCHSHSTPTRTCWKCGADTSPERELFFCDCGVVQTPAKHFSYFDLLQVGQRFDVDIIELGQHFKDTQKLLHPDKFSTHSKEERNFAEEQSSLLNKSYFTLLKPLSRAIYMLELHDITISENDSVSDQQFLMDMMEDFESIDSASSADDVESLEKSNDKRICKCIKELSGAFSQSKYADAKNLTIRLRYFTTIQDRIKELRMKSFG